MKVFVRRNNVAKFGYELVIDDKVVDITSKTTDGYFRVPVLETTHNIKMLKISTIESNLNENGEYEVLPREARAPRTVTNSQSAPRKTSNFYEYLTDEEKEIYKELEAKAMKRMMIVKAKAEYEKAQAEYERLTAEAQA